MKYYVFRNSTIEPFLGVDNYVYSGYGDIQLPADDYDIFIWWYTYPIKMNVEECISEISSYIERLRYVVENIIKSKTIYVFSLTKNFVINFTDSFSQFDLVVNKFNEEIEEIADRGKNIKILHIDNFLSNYSLENLIDWKYYYLSQIPFKLGISNDFKKWFSKKINNMEQKRKKCLVLDLDNTLWGGVLGEDGINGIKIGNGYPDKCFFDFQQAILEAAKNGIILTLCSKNNEEDVLELFEKRSSMPLKLNNFSACRINWENKAQNISELAKELNIGLDSFVFIDDNPIEREFVKELLPEVTIPEFPNNPYELLSFFKKIYEQYFAVYSIVEEDIKKTNQYRDNSKRFQFKRKFGILDDFIKALEIKIDVYCNNDNYITRIAQMTQKTNQFNLTTKRYNENDIRNFMNSDYVLCFNVKDKFGDNGITALIIGKVLDEKSLEIDTLLLSCRILGKNIENEILRYSLNMWKEKGFKKVYSTYKKSKKNKQTENYYDRNNFNLIEYTESEKRYEITLEKKIELSKKYEINLEEK